MKKQLRCCVCSYSLLSFVRLTTALRRFRAHCINCKLNMQNYISKPPPSARFLRTWMSKSLLPFAYALSRLVGRRALKIFPSVQILLCHILLPTLTDRLRGVRVKKIFFLLVVVSIIKTAPVAVKKVEKQTPTVFFFCSFNTWCSGMSDM